MQQIISTDGTAIACRQTGQGVALLLIHGTAGDHLGWRNVVPFLEKHFTVWTLDRRGRGASGDNQSYSLQHEADDIVAVIQAIGGKVAVFAHSFGGLCALEAVLHTDKITSLMLYEPPLSLGSAWSQVAQQMQNLLANNAKEEVVRLFFRDILRLPKEEMLALQLSSHWPARILEAHTIERELRAIAAYQFPKEYFQQWQTPTLLMLGSDSPPRLQQIIALLNKDLANSQLALLPGQRHNAMRTAPELVARQIIAFLEKHSFR